jgi:hypothetical protein
MSEHRFLGLLMSFMIRRQRSLTACCDLYFPLCHCCLQVRHCRPNLSQDDCFKATRARVAANEAMGGSST